MRYTDFLEALLIRGRSKKRLRALTLVELLLAIAIIGTLSAIAVPIYNNYIDKARNSRAIADIHEIEGWIAKFQAERGRLPDTLAETGLPTKLDPWGNPYQFLRLQTEDKQVLAGTLAKAGNPTGLNSGKNLQQSLSFQGIDKQGLEGNWRRDRMMNPLNTDFDLYSMGKNGVSVPPLTAEPSWDDIVRANNGAFIGLASDY